MTRRTNARVAGFTFLLYIAVALTGMVLSNRAVSGEGVIGKALRERGRGTLPILGGARAGAPAARRAMAAPARVRVLSMCSSVS